MVTSSLVRACSSYLEFLRIPKNVNQIKGVRATSSHQHKRLYYGYIAIPDFLVRMSSCKQSVF